MDQWMMENMPNIMLTIEIFLLIFVAAIFVAYFKIKRDIKNRQK